MATAITYSRFGGPEVLEVSEVEPAHPGRNQIRVRVRTTTVNGIDVKLRRGVTTDGDELGTAPPQSDDVTQWRHG